LDAGLFTVFSSPVFVRQVPANSFDQKYSNLGSVCSELFQAKILRYILQVKNEAVIVSETIFHLDNALIEGQAVF